MSQSNKILVMVFPGESPADAEIRIERDLVSISNLRPRWNEIKDMSHDSVEFIEGLRDFFGDFQSVWELSSPKTIACIGIEDCLAIFELASAWKHLVWPIHLLELYNNLPDQVQIFRGGAGSVEDVLSGHSWTLDIGFAQVFATNSNGIVVSAMVTRDGILLLGDIELEVIPRRASLHGAHEILDVG